MEGTLYHRYRRRVFYVIIVLFVAGAVYRKYSVSSSLTTDPVQDQVSAGSEPLSKEAVCVREVLKTLQLPFSRPDYSLQSLEHPLDLTRLSWPCRAFLIPSYQRREQLVCFTTPVFRPSERERMRMCLRLIRDTFDRTGIILALNAGTMLGSWRRHGWIPHDPDIDLLIPHQDLPRAVRLMKTLQKMHPHLMKSYEMLPDFWRIDIKGQSGFKLAHIDMYMPKMYNEDEFKKDRKLSGERLWTPFIQRPFEGMLFKVKSNMHDYFRERYGSDVNSTCSTHPKMRWLFYAICGPKTTSCSDLDYFFNFVKRWEHADSKLVEVLFNRSHALSVFYSPGSTQSHMRGDANKSLDSLV